MTIHPLFRRIITITRRVERQQQGQRGILLLIGIGGLKKLGHIITIDILEVGYKGGSLDQKIFSPIRLDQAKKNYEQLHSAIAASRTQADILHFIIYGIAIGGAK